jgi:hypothetical protein
MNDYDHWIYLTGEDVKKMSYRSTVAGKTFALNERD